MMEMFYTDLFLWLKYKLRTYFYGCCTDEMWENAQKEVDNYFEKLSKEVGYGIKPVFSIAGDIFFIRDCAFKAPDKNGVWFGIWELYGQVIDYLEFKDMLNEEDIYKTFNREFKGAMYSVPKKDALPFLSLENKCASFVVDEKYFKQQV